MLSGAARLQGLLGLSDEELLAVLAADPLDVIGGETDITSPELPILLRLLDEAQETVGASLLRRWIRAHSTATGGRPVDLLLDRRFAEFEDALTSLRERGFVIKAPSSSE